MPSPSPQGESAIAAQVEALVQRLLTLDWGEGRVAALEAWRQEVFEAVNAWPPPPELRHRIGNLLSPAVTHAYLLTRPNLAAGEQADLRGRIERAVHAALRSASGGTDSSDVQLRSALPPATAAHSVDLRTDPRPLVLVVDDEERILRAVDRFLRGSRFRVRGCAEASGAIEAFAREPHAYGLALIDWEMPGMDGGSLAEVLRASRPDLPIVFATGHPVTETDLRVRSLERCTVLEKPLDPGSLADTLERCIRRGT